MSDYTAIVIPHDNAPELARVTHEESLKFLQGKVGGYIEAVYSDDGRTTFFCHDEAKFPEDWRDRINEPATLLWWILNPAARNVDVLVGNVIVTGGADNNGDTLSVNPSIIHALGLLP